MGIFRKQNRRNRRGMTLLEVTFAISILVTAILCALSALMNTITANRLMTANATANAAILHQREAVQQIAAGGGKLPAAAIVEHYADKKNYVIGDASGDNGIAVGPNGAAMPKVSWDGSNRGLVYTFELPGPAESVNSAAPFNRGYGQMLLYLDETAVPATVTWNDLGDGTGASTGAGSGYDINGDGDIANGLTAAARSDLANGNFESFNEAVGPLRLPVDISVYYFTDASHSRLLYDTTRRSMFIGLNDTHYE